MGLAVSSRAAVTLHSIRGLTPLIFQHCPLFHCRFIALKSRTFVVKSRTTFAIKFVRDLNAKNTPMGDCGGGCLGRGGKQRSLGSSRQELIGIVSQLVLNASTDCDMYERRARYRKDLKVWKSQLVPLTPEARRSLARVSRAW